MPQWLKQSTAVKVVVGPFVNDTDGVSPMSDVDISSMDAAEFAKHNTSDVFAVGTDALASIDNADGFYHLELIATDVDVLGNLDALFADADVHLPVMARFMVMPAVVFDGMVMDTDYIQVHVMEQDSDITFDTWEEIMDTDITFQQVMRLTSAVLAGKSSGGGTATDVFRDLEDGKDRITATVDSDGNRTAITLDLT